MPILAKLRSLFRNLLRREQADADLDQEVRSYVNLLADEKIQAGITPEQAARAARIEAGGIEQVKEEVRSARRGAWLASVLQDLRYAARMLRKSPAFTLTAVLTLAIGLGVNTAVFSVAEFLFRPLPVKNPDQLVVLATGQNGHPAVNGFSYPEYLDLKQQASDFSDLIGYEVEFEGLSTGRHATQFFTLSVTGNYFTMLGVHPYLGRLFLPSEGKAPGADPYLVLGYSFWKKEFHGDADVVGRRVVVRGQPVIIIGVTPPEFHGTFYAFDTQGYLLLSTEAADPQTGGFWSKRENRELTIMGRLRPGISLAQAQASVNVIAGRFAQQYPNSSKTLLLRAYPEDRARPQPDPTDQTPLVTGIFLALAALVTLLACLNVANLMLVRATARYREMVVRAALGAGRGRLVRQLLTESMLLACLGGAAGVLLGVWGAKLLGTIPARITQLPFQTDFAVNWRVFGYGLGAVVVAGMVVGILPARRGARIDLSAVLRESGRSVVGGRHRLRDTLVVAQIAGSLVLLIIAGLFTRSLENVLHSKLGFDPDHLVTFTVNPHEMGYTQEQGRKFFRELLQRARALPGVESACLAYSSPFGYYNSSATLAGIDSRALGKDRPLIGYNVVGTEYFSTLRIPLLRGRDFQESDTQNSVRVAIVNQTMARRYWPGRSALGQQFKSSVDGPEQWFQVVGVVADAKYTSMTESGVPYFYVPLTQNYSAIEAVHVRSQLAPHVVLGELQEQVGELAPNLPVFYAKSMNDELEDFNGRFLYRLGATVAAGMGLLGMLLAVIGVYGVASYAASQRTHEIGVRMALGAARSDILVTVLRNGLWLVGAGIALGLALVLAATRVVADFLVGVSATDPLTFAAVSFGLALVAVAACYIPARRAMQLDPMVALRYE
ncbi:MAG TPA: ABC transporter permease [Terriglobales bacterium]|nr:ABC transporter permease [Terriglobales bacterium]